MKPALKIRFLKEVLRKIINKTKVFNDIAFSVIVSEVLGTIGDSSSNKATLINCLLMAFNKIEEKVFEKRSTQKFNIWIFV